MLRHTLATLAYRAGKVLRDAPEGFADFRPSEGSRSAGEILAHMGDLMEWAASIAEGKERWKDSQPLPWNVDRHRFFDNLAHLDECLAGPLGAGAPADRLFQGPVADALTHVGQLAMMRRLAGVPIRGENYFKADISEGRIGLNQPAPRREF